MSYGGVSRMEEYVRERLGIEPFDTEASKNALVLFIEIRNLHTHNRGVVNDLFLSRVRDHMGFTFKRGEAIHVHFDMFEQLVENSVAVALRMDQDVGAKFKIARKKFATWQAAAKR